MLIILGAWGLLRGGEVRALPLVLLVIGLLMALVAAFDIPLEVGVDADGVERRCLARTQRFAWDDVVGFGRTRSGRVKRGFGASAEAEPVSSQPAGMGDPKTGRGGLVLETVARRQYLLSAGRERPDTYVALESSVSRYAPGLSMPGPPYYPRSETSL